MLCKITATFHSPARPCDENHCSPSLKSGKYNNIEKNIQLHPLAVLTRQIDWCFGLSLSSRKQENGLNILSNQYGKECQKCLWEGFCRLMLIVFPAWQWCTQLLSTRVCSVNLISYVDNVVENVEVTNYGNIFSENPPNCCTPTWHNGPVTRLYGKPFANVLIMPLWALTWTNLSPSPTVSTVIIACRNQ